MIERNKQELKLARQLFKHDDHMIFRIFATVHKLPKTFPHYHESKIYELKVQTVPPYSCYINYQYIRDFQTWKTAWSISQERVNTVSRQFGFDRVGVLQWFEKRVEK